MNGRIRNNNNNKEKWILYSTCDEDSLSELRALNISERDRVVSVTGSGCRTLSLLSCNPNSLVSVDYSAGQNYLLELKLAAIRELSYDGLLRFLGIDRCAQRWQTFELLERYLSPQAAAYFRRYRSAIQKGVLFSGRHELFYARFVVPIVHLLFGRTLKRIFDASTVEEQRKAVVAARDRENVIVGNEIVNSTEPCGDGLSETDSPSLPFDLFSMIISIPLRLM